jgi:hypothetical protein
MAMLNASFPPPTYRICGGAMGRWQAIGGIWRHEAALERGRPFRTPEALE